MGKEKKRKHARDEDEDPAERDKRKAAKKAEKVAKMLGYTNDTNPFGDSNLLQPFVWGKKVAKDKAEGRKTTEMDSEEHRLKLMQDIDRVRKRREERENELAEMERLRSEEQRLREMASYGDWQQKEEEFHLEQTAVRSRIRLLEHRQQPIDVLAKNILLVESAAAEDGGLDQAAMAGLEVEIRDPVTLVEGLNAEQLEQLVSDCDAYMQLESLKKGAYVDFWRAMKVVVAAERRKKAGERPVHQTVVAEVEQLFRGKSDEELDRLQRDIDKTIRERRGDVSYWEQMAQEVTLQRARTQVATTHMELLTKQLEALTQLRAKERGQARERDTGEGEGEGVEEAYALQQLKELEGKSSSRSSSSSSSSSSSFSLGMASSSSSSGGTIDPQRAAQLEQARGLDEKDEAFDKRTEVTLPGATYWWQDKYRPRKPRYLNRVRTGWDWNKYNQTHYDFDNPPPRKIQGYKFTIFYPDLIDKTKTPRFFLEAADEPEFAILRFSGGPPYEDVAFKIVNKEWEVHRKAGYRCVFDRGVLQLHFNFKRTFYRR